MIWLYMLEALLIGLVAFVTLKHSYSIRLGLASLQTKAHNQSKHALFGKLRPLLWANGMGKHQSKLWWNRNWAVFRLLFIVSIFLSFWMGSIMTLLMPWIFALFQYYKLVRQIRIRKSAILRRIPFVLDMLTLNLQSGLDFISSLEELVEMNDKHPLHDEIRITLQSMHVGESRSQAFQNLGLRTQVSELSHLAAVIRQSETMGSSLIELLKLQSHEIRHRIFKLAEGEAQKAPVKILIPMLAFIFPVVFIILFVPIGIQLMNNLK